jgi:hypothetical protein
MTSYSKFETLAHRLLFSECLGLPVVVQRLQNGGLSGELAKSIALGALTRDFGLGNDGRNRFHPGAV